jgi:uncharacterized membrane protein
MASEAKGRLVGLDVFRGWAIAMMIVFHFAYDLAWFRFTDADLSHDLFWIYFRYVIVSIFMVSVGISLSLVHTPRIRWDRVKHRAVMLGAASATVTIATYIQSPYWVYFGILHLIWVVSLVGLIFVGRAGWALVTALVIFYATSNGWLLDVQHAFFKAVHPILHLPRGTEDLARFFPWFGAVLMGIAAHGWGWHRIAFAWPLLAAPNALNRALAFMGRHALAIYLIHLPVLYGLVMGWRLLVE